MLLASKILAVAGLFLFVAAIAFMKMQRRCRLTA